jgi:hypothetical protein
MGDTGMGGQVLKLKIGKTVVGLGEHWESWRNTGQVQKIVRCRPFVISLDTVSLLSGSKSYIYPHLW